MDDRIEQAKRMGWLCDKVAKTGNYVIADFICPTEECRKAFGDCFLVFVDTVKESEYEDTNKIFEPPKRYDFVVREKNAKFYAEMIKENLHEGHIKLIQTVLNEGKDGLVALRDTPINEENPYSIAERKKCFMMFLEIK